MIIKLTKPLQSVEEKVPRMHDGQTARVPGKLRKSDFLSVVPR